MPGVEAVQGRDFGERTIGVLRTDEEVVARVLDESCSGVVAEKSRSLASFGMTGWCCECEQQPSIKGKTAPSENQEGAEPIRGKHFRILRSIEV